MARKLLVIVTALIVPGGLIALFGALFLRQLSRTERGQRVLQWARARVPAVAGQLSPQMREAA